MLSHVAVFGLHLHQEMGGLGLACQPKSFEQCCAFNVLEVVLLLEFAQGHQV